MKNHLVFFIIACTTIAHSQINPIDFEPGGIGADWTFTVFENEDNPPLEFVANPDTSGINTSDTVARFTAREAGAPFVGCETMHGADVGTFTLSSENAFVSMMVFKTVLSDVGFKFATPQGASTGEIKVANTTINQWERLVFDFTGVIGEPSSSGIDQIIIFPDFQDRTTENIIYFDNIVFGDETLLSVQTSQSISSKIYPNPVSNKLHINALQKIETITLFSIQGQVLIEKSGLATTEELDISTISPGYYFIKIKTENTEEMRNLLIK